MMITLHSSIGWPCPRALGKETKDSMHQCSSASYPEEVSFFSNSHKSDVNATCFFFLLETTVYADPKIRSQA